eukprot:COSAG05_NODE_259_length_12737_cov_42.436145_5_plen_93_part_00
MYVFKSVHSAILIGFLSALCSTLLVGVVPDDSAEGKLQVALVLLGAYLSYEAAESLHLPGIVSCLACGVGKLSTTRARVQVNSLVRLYTSRA